MTTAFTRSDRYADLQDWQPTIVAEHGEWAMPARGHGVRYLESRAASVSPLCVVCVVRVAVAVVAASLVYLFA